MDGDGVGPAKRMEFDRLDAVQVHRDRSDVAEEANAAAIGRDIDVLGDVRAEEVESVEARLTFDRVAAVARVPPELVVSGAEQRQITTLVTVDEVVAVAAEQDVRPLTAGD